MEFPVPVLEKSEPVDPVSPEQLQQQKSPSKPQARIFSSKRITGTVKWFNAKEGFGFITRHDTGEDVFVHKSSILKPNRRHIFKSVGDGEEVEFGLIASKVTGPGFKPVKGSRFVAHRGGRKSRPMSRTSERSKKSLRKEDSVGDGSEELERRTQMLAIKSNSNGVVSERPEDQCDERGGASAGSAESISTAATNETEE